MDLLLQLISPDQLSIHLEFVQCAPHLSWESLGWMDGEGASIFSQRAVIAMGKQSSQLANAEESTHVTCTAQIQAHV